jgi:hypothetical protein
MNCDQAQDRLLTTTAPDAELQAHLDTCTVCRAVAELTAELTTDGQRARQADLSAARVGDVRRRAAAAMRPAYRLWVPAAAALLALAAAALAWAVIRPGPPAAAPPRQPLAPAPAMQPQELEQTIDDLRDDLQTRIAAATPPSTPPAREPSALRRPMRRLRRRISSRAARLKDELNELEDDRPEPGPNETRQQPTQGDKQHA